MQLNTILHPISQRGGKMVFQIPFNRKNSIFQGEVKHFYRLNCA